MAENVKAYWKKAKVEKKLAKKKKKEDEFLANLRKPKDTKVVLADRSLVERLVGKNVTPSPGRPSFLAEDFPALPGGTRAGAKAEKPMSYNGAVRNAWSARESCPPAGAGEGNGSVPPVESETESPHFFTKRKADGESGRSMPEEPNKRAVSKKAKKRDPIVVKLDDLIVKSTMTKKDKREANCKGPRQGAERGVLCGNMLDSSNPKRSKGKRREIKKLKLSKLKMSIIRDRIAKLKARDPEEETVDETNFKSEVHKYLSDLTEKKSAMAEKRRAKQGEKEGEGSGEPEERTGAEAKKRKERPTKYRKYCGNKYSEELDKSVKALVEKIVYLQDRAFNKDPIKSKVKRRHVVGLREAKKYLMLKKIKMLILAPDLEAQGSVCNVIEDLKSTASLQNVPCVFALSRRKLGATIRKPVPVSAFGIMNYDGLESKFKDVKEKLKEIQDLHSAQNGASDENLNDEPQPENAQPILT